jgi:hypothetical protein
MKGMHRWIFGTDRLPRCELCGYIDRRPAPPPQAYAPGEFELAMQRDFDAFTERCIQRIRDAKNAAPPPQASATRHGDLVDALFGLACNVNGGDLSKQTPEWREAFDRARDEYAKRAPSMHTQASATPYERKLSDRDLDRLGHYMPTITQEHFMLVADLRSCELALAAAVKERDEARLDATVRYSRDGEDAKALQELLDVRNEQYDSLRSTCARLERERDEAQAKCGVQLEKVAALAKQIDRDERLHGDEIDERDRRQDQLVEVVRELGDGDSEWSNVCDMGNRAVELAAEKFWECEQLRTRLARALETLESIERLDLPPPDEKGYSFRTNYGSLGVEDHIRAKARATLRELRGEQAKEQAAPSPILPGTYLHDALKDPEVRAEFEAETARLNAPPLSPAVAEAELRVNAVVLSSLEAFLNGTVQHAARGDVRTLLHDYHTLRAALEQRAAQRDARDDPRTRGSCHDWTTGNCPECARPEDCPDYRRPAAPAAQDTEA